MIPAQAHTVPVLPPGSCEGPSSWSAVSARRQSRVALPRHEHQRREGRKGESKATQATHSPAFSSFSHAWRCGGPAAPVSSSACCGAADAGSPSLFRWKSPPGRVLRPLPLKGPPGTTRHQDPVTSPGCTSPTPACRPWHRCRAAGLTPGTISVGDRQERNPRREAKRRPLSALPVTSPLMERSRREEGPGAAPVMEKPWGSPGSHRHPAGPQQPPWQGTGGYNVLGTCHSPWGQP